MKTLTFDLDFISPYAYLAFEALPQALQGLSYRVAYRPVLLAGLLKHHGQLGPAEIAAKRLWTYRQVQWLGREQQVPFDLPASHPFNPLPLLRLALACSDGPYINRYVAQTVFHHVWQGGGEATDTQRMAALAEQLQLRHSSDASEVKDRLRSNTDAAIAAGVFGVPTVTVDEQVFWGLDALRMLRAYLQGDPWFAGAPWRDAAERPR